MEVEVAHQGPHCSGIAGTRATFLPLIAVVVLEAFAKSKGAQAFQTLPEEGGGPCTWKSREPEES